ncbi:Spen-like protein SPOC, C-terminal [Dillenia turbinata]|uniref:Spen-like protein SPOC, C-terminal n=1 Tax=Dillenia turbinata TaxID=194707 RepID=A0AAN8W856_9MAGN
MRMWKHKQKVLADQMALQREALPSAYLEPMLLPPGSGVSGIDLIRKRKFAAIDQPGPTPESDTEYLQNKLNLQHEANALQGQNKQVNLPGLLLNQNFRVVEPVHIGHQGQADQFHGQKNLPEAWQTTARSKYKLPVETLNNSYLHLRGDEPMAKSPVAPESNKWLPQALISHSPTEKKQKAEVVPSHDLVIIGQKKQVLTGDLPMEVCDGLLEILHPLGSLLQNSIPLNTFIRNVDRKVVSNEFKRVNISADLEQSSQSIITAADDVLTMGNTSLRAFSCINQNDSCSSLLNKTHFRCAAAYVAAAECRNQNDPDPGDQEAKILTPIEGSVIEKIQPPSENTTKNHGSPASLVIGHGCINEQSQKINEAGKSLAQKLAPMAAEKLWEGSLQLNSTITVSVIAFYRSGEKMPDITWYESVEVKGKVRLEAFEKYIQDLPRSRNRSLMVISLCWKEGSSKTGLKGMKEVAKGYMKGERVGFAHLTSGSDIYICPQSDTIITILAKHGYYKGMAAVQENQDSLLGCVVWRRNQSSSLVERKCEKKTASTIEKPLYFSSDPSIPKVMEKNQSPPQPAKEAKANSIWSVESCKSREISNNNGTENMRSSAVQPEVGKSLVDVSASVAPSVKNSSSSLSVDFRSSEIPAVHNNLVGQAPGINGSESHRSGSAILSHADSLQHSKPAAAADDDLPEFDFRTACGTAPKPANDRVDMVAQKRRTSAGGIRKESVNLSVPIQQAVEVSNQSSKGVRVMKFSTDPTQRVPVPNKACHYECQFSPLPRVEEKHSVEARALMTSLPKAPVPPPGSPFDPIQRVTLQNKVYKHESRISPLPIVKENHSVEGGASVTSFTTAPMPPPRTLINSIQRVPLPNKVCENESRVPPLPIVEEKTCMEDRPPMKSLAPVPRPRSPIDPFWAPVPAPRSPFRKVPLPNKVCENESQIPPPPIVEEKTCVDGRPMKSLARALVPPPRSPFDPIWAPVPSPRSPFHPIQGVPLPNKVSERESQTWPLPVDEEKLPSGSSTQMRSFTGAPVPPPRCLFNEDDDDMPEWQPPGTEFHPQPVTQDSRLPTKFVPFEAPKSTSERLPASSGPLLQALFSTEGSPYSFTSRYPPTSSRYIRRVPSASMEHKGSVTLRPQTDSSDIKFPDRCTDSRVWWQ